MNKGFKNHSKRITQTVGNVAEVSVNVNRADRNIHITMPLISTVGKCPIDTSLIFDLQSSSIDSKFGKGTRLNFHSQISQNGNNYELTNNDGSTDVYLNSREYFNIETGLTLKHIHDVYELDYHYELTDAQGNYIEIDEDGDYPRIIKKANGDKISFDFTSATKSISNEHGDMIMFYGSPRITRVEYYCFSEYIAKAEISYDTNNYIKEIVYYNNNNTVVKKLSLSISDNIIVVKDAISDYRIQYNLSPAIISIKDGYDDSFAKGSNTSIRAIGGRTEITDNYGRVSYVLFDSDNFPIYEVDHNGSVVEYTFDKETNMLKFKSAPIHTRQLDENLAAQVTPTLDNVTERVLDVVDDLDNILVGDFCHSYWGNGAVTYTINQGGIDTDSVTAMVFGRFIGSLYQNAVARVTLKLLSETGEIVNEKEDSISNLPSGDFNIAILGVCASSSYSRIELVVDLPDDDAVMEIGGVRIVKRECGAFYDYDAQGNVIETVVGHKSKTATYEAGKASEMLGVHSNNTNYEYNDKKQLVKSLHAYGATVEYEYDEIHTNNISKTVATDGTGSIRIETAKTYTDDGRFVSAETDASGLVKSYSYSDQTGNISSVRDTMSIITNYEYFSNGLLEELKITDGNNASNSSSAKYTYDSKMKIETVTLDNGSLYKFEYDGYGNIAAIKLNNVVIFKYEYDNKNRLIKQYYGETSDYYEFTYTTAGMINEIYYVNNGSRILKYKYHYDIINRVAKVTDSEDNILSQYEYDANGKVMRVANSSSTIETEYDNLGDVTIKRTNVNGNKIYQSYDTINRSKGSHPSIIFKNDHIFINGAYFGTFYDDAAARNPANGVINSVNHYGSISNLATTLDGGIPCCEINANKLLSYELPMERANPQECGFISFCFKPKSIRSQHLFSAKSADDHSSINIYMDATGTVRVNMTDMFSNVYNILTCTNKVVANDWNYFAISFMLREGFSGGGRTQVYVNLNGNIDTYNYDNLINFYLGRPAVYNIGHKYNGTFSSECFEGLISCVNFTPRDDIGTNSMNKHYKYIKDYILDNALIDKTIGAVDFSDVNLYTNNSNILNNFRIFPLNNSIKSINGELPVCFENRSVGKNDKNRNFAYNTKIKRYAYVAEGFDLKYALNSDISGTIMMKAYVNTLDDRQYFFDTKDSAGRTLGLFRNSSRVICIDYNGEIIPTRFVLNDKEWHPLGLSFTTQNADSNESAPKKLDIRVYFDDEVHEFIRSTFEDYKADCLSVGKSFTAIVSSGYIERDDHFGPLQGQIEMLVYGSSFCDNPTINTLVESEIKAYTKVCSFDELGMLKKTEIHCDGIHVLSNTITYKKNDINTTPCVANEMFKYRDTTISRDYTTDLYGRVTAMSDIMFGNHTYEYDYRGFLVREDDKTFAYDKNGNITRCGDTLFTYDSVIKDRLMSVGGKAITYSEQNPLNPLTYDGNTFEFEGRRLVRVTSDNMVADYKYNSSGLRIEKVVTKNNSTTITKYIYDNGKLICEYTDDERVDYLYDENGLLYGFIYDNERFFYMRDTLQNILGIVNVHGIPVVYYNYSAYGVCNSITGALASTVGKINSFRYKGYYFDDETQLYWVSSRYYSPELCRWISPDSIEYLDPESINGLNLYAYCGNDPVNKYDPTGHFGIWAIIGIVGAAILLGGGAQLASNALAGETGSDLWRGVAGAALGSGVNALALCLSPFTGGASLAFAAGLGAAVQTGVDTLETVIRGETVNGWQTVADLGINFITTFAGNWIGSKLIPTNSGWFEPKKFLSVFMKPYGQKILLQTAIGAGLSGIVNFARKFDWSSVDWKKIVPVIPVPMVPIYPHF